MTNRKPAFDLLTDEQRQQCIENIIAYFLDERDEEIGVIAAEQLLETVQEAVTISAYNHAIDDTAELMRAKLSDLQVELDILKKK